MKWNTDETTYYDRGAKAYSKGDEVPSPVLVAMGEETVKEFLEKSWLTDGKTKLVDEKKAMEEKRLELLEKATGLGLRPHNRTGIDKLNAMIADFNALEALKKEALELGIDPSDDVTFAELTKLVDEKKAEE